MSITKTIGIILFRMHGKSVQYLLLHHGKKYWNFPKGRPDSADKNDLDTAFREAREETGIFKNQIRLVKSFKVGYVYKFRRPKEWGACEKIPHLPPSLFFELRWASNPPPLRKREDKIKITKRAIFYLGEALAGQVKISDEHIDFGWFNYHQALKKLAGLKGLDSDSCRLLKKAEKFIIHNW